MSASKPLQSQTVKELRSLAAALQISGRSKLTTKAKLIAAIEKAQARPANADAKGPTVAALREICRKRKLTGWSRLTKAQLVRLVESTNQLTQAAPTLDAQILQTEADLARIEDARILHRIMFANNSGRPAAQIDISHWRGIETRAVQSLRDATTCEQTRRELSNRYVAVTSGVMA